MIGKAAFATGLGVGYVLGTRAGRERFDQIVNQSHNLWNKPAVQDAKDTAQSQASKLYDDSKHRIGDRLGRQESEHPSTRQSSGGVDTFGSGA
jgi:hypothetical protein